MVKAVFQKSIALVLIAIIIVFSSVPKQAEANPVALLGAEKVVELSCALIAVSAGAVIYLEKDELARISYEVYNSASAKQRELLNDLSDAMSKGTTATVATSKLKSVLQRTQLLLSDSLKQSTATMHPVRYIPKDASYILDCHDTLNLSVLEKSRAVYDFVNFCVETSGSYTVYYHAVTINGHLYALPSYIDKRTGQPCEVPYLNVIFSPSGTSAGDLLYKAGLLLLNVDGLQYDSYPVFVDGVMTSLPVIDVADKYDKFPSLDLGWQLKIPSANFEVPDHYYFSHTGVYFTLLAIYGYLSQFYDYGSGVLVLNDQRNVFHNVPTIVNNGELAFRDNTIYPGDPAVKPLDLTTSTAVPKVLSYPKSLTFDSSSKMALGNGVYEMPAVVADNPAIGVSLDYPIETADVTVEEPPAIDLDGIKDFLKSILEALRAILSAIKAIPSILNDIYDLMRDLVRAMADAVAAAFTSILTDIKDAIKAIPDVFSALFDKVVDAIKAAQDVFTATWAKVLEAIKAIPSAVTGAISATLSAILEKVKAIPDALTALKEAILSALTTLTNPILEAIDKVIEALKHFFDVSAFQLDFSKLRLSDLKTVFPFCIPFDIFACIKTFDAPASFSPSIDLETQYFSIHQTIDLSSIQGILGFVRGVEVVFFVIMLYLITKRIMKW